MAIADDIAAIDADGNLTAEQKRAAKYDVKNLALLDVILNGKPAPGPIPPLLGREFTQDGKTYRVDAASATAGGALRLIVTINGAQHQLVITNPPTLPRVITGSEKQDLIQAAVEMLDGFV
jgi:hypothetical protein